MRPLKKQDAQVVDLQGGNPFLFLVSLPPAGRGWFANKSLQAAASGRGFGSLGGINKFTQQNMKTILAMTAAVSLLVGCSTSSQHSRTWEYETVTGKVDNSKTDRLADKINIEANQGWEFVSSGGLEGFYGYAVLKREKK